MESPVTTERHFRFAKHRFQLISDIALFNIKVIFADCFKLIQTIIKHEKNFHILFIIVISAGFRARADEGMWLLPLIEKLNMGKMTELGLKLSAEDIYS